MMLFMIKYGKEKHLKQIVNGLIWFAPSQTYVKIEEALHNKGQGDLLEGKMTFKAGNRYRILLRKDVEFKKQQEYRFIIFDELSAKPVFCRFEFNSQHLIIPIDELKSGVAIELRNS